MDGDPAKLGLTRRLGRSLERRPARNARQRPKSRAKLVVVLLRVVATCLQACVRGTDTAARLGGDEFGLVPPHTGEHGAPRVASKVLAALTEPVVLGEVRIQVGGSIGIALHPEHGEDAETLKRCADAAMYAAKRAGGGYFLHDADRGGLEGAIVRSLTGVPCPAVGFPVVNRTGS